MSQNTFGVITPTSKTINSDTTAQANTLVQRDSDGGLISTTVQASDNLQTNGTFTGKVVAKTADFTAGAATDYAVDCTSGAVTVTLPLASASNGVTYGFVKTDASGSQITVTGALGVSTTSAQYDTIHVISDGTNWYGRI